MIKFVTGFCASHLMLISTSGRSKKDSKRIFSWKKWLVWLFICSIVQNFLHSKLIIKLAHDTIRAYLFNLYDFD